MRLFLKITQAFFPKVQDFRQSFKIAWRLQDIQDLWGRWEKNVHRPQSLRACLCACLRVSPSELEERLGGGRGAGVGPGEEVELGDGAGLACLDVLQVEGPDQVVVTPDVLGHKVNLGRGQMRRLGLRTYLCV